MAVENILKKLDEIEKKALEKINTAGSLDDLENLRVVYLGRKAELTQILRSLKELSADDRRVVGARANKVRALIEEKLESKRTALQSQGKREWLDFTLPGKIYFNSHEHPVKSLIDRICEIFIGLGYEVVTGPEAELDYYNFTALNIQPYHPARSMHDTLYLSEDNLFEMEDATEEDLKKATRNISLLRTHTSPVQIRTMLERKPPLFIVAPGKCYRKDVPDATHSPVFHQIEGLAVAENIRFSDLKGTLEVFLKELFGKDTRVRFRASYFPFTEPSAEVDVSCIICGAKGCRVCSQTGWLEVLGAGMVHPAVLEEVGYDSERYTGFAFGMGVERLAMLKHGIPDIRLFFENNLKFLSQF